MKGIDEAIKPIKVISASAGTGKTSRLSGEYLKALRSGCAGGRSEGGIIATTFTNKAADELVERVRRNLLQEGHWQAAQGVLTGYLGTVNAICGRIVSEHAIEAGLSPDFSVVSDEQRSNVFATAVDAVIHEFAEEIDQAATRLQIDWQAHVHDIIDLARNNDLGAKLLERFASDSWQRLERFLTSPEQGAAVLDQALMRAVDEVAQQLKEGHDRGDATAHAVDYLNEIDRNLKSGRVLNWQAWARLERLYVNRESEHVIKPLVTAASAHSRHPRLHDDLRTTIFGVFRCAAAALQEYTRFKREHGLIDFVDQEHLALRLLRVPEVRASFKEKARVLLVDEFQDTSPIQLAVFLEMARLVDYSVWVGDEKQSIFGFRGSDPELMGQAVAQLVSQSGARRFRLSRSYRSRPSLVHFVNELFSRSATLMQIKAESARIEEIERTERDGQNAPLHLWWLQDSRDGTALCALAQSVAALLANALEWPVVDRQSGLLRPIRGSDIAVLCRTNRARAAMAKALSLEGLTIATERNALLDTPECMLTLAALRYLVDESDSLALAELASFLIGDESGKPEESDSSWLTDWLSSGAEAVEQRLACVRALREARFSLVDRTPCEALELAIAGGGIIETAMSWGNVRQRLANLDAMRGLARAFEELCLGAKVPGTAAGLVVHLNRHVKDGGNQPANPDENGIHILTYHRAKGLEWPLVLLYELDASGRGSPFGITVESLERGLDPLQPLKGRSIRYWPWPYGQQRNNVGLEAAVAKTPEARDSKMRTTAENLRLLYVGMTRARDYLVLAAKPVRTRFKSGTAWLDTAVDQAGEKILSLPFPDNKCTTAQIIDGISASATRIEVKSALPAAAFSAAADGQVFGPISRQVEASTPGVRYHLSPSSASGSDVNVLEGAAPETIVLGPRLPLVGVPDMARLGDAFHAALCLDLAGGDPDPDLARRLAGIERVLGNWKIDNFRACDLLEASERLRKFIAAVYPGSKLSAEVPVQGRFALRRSSGSIDLLVSSPSGYAIIDHKTSLGRPELVQEQALVYRQQLALYKHLVEQATGRKVLAQYIHMPVVGKIVRVDCTVLS